MKKQFTPAHVWRRISRCIAAYGGEFDKGMYEQLRYWSMPASISIAAMQEDGIEFPASACRHWALELCGAFEVTHRKYQPPKGADHPTAFRLYHILTHIFHLEEQA